jgi:hypothetical protein
MDIEERATRVDQTDPQDRAARTEARAVASLVYDQAGLPRPKFYADASLDKEVREMLKSKPGRGVDDWFHPSTFGRWCRRREVLRMLSQSIGLELSRSRPAPTLGLIFEAGHSVHRHYRNVLVPHKMLGWWRCGRCGHPHGFEIATNDEGWEQIVPGELIPRPESCNSCGYTVKDSYRQSYEVYMEFIEPPIQVDKYRIKGHTDGLIRHLNRLMVGEFKSEDPKLWDERRGPEPGHMMQAACYALGLQETYGIAAKFTAAIYINKSTYRAKTYVFKNEEQVAWIKQEIDDVHTLKALLEPDASNEEAIREFHMNPEMDARAPRVCASPDVSQAKTCPLRDICFNVKKRRRTK